MIRVLLSLVLLFALAASPAAAFRNVEVGTLVDSPALMAEDGMPEPLLGGACDAPTVVVFWATWSPRSEEALADLQQLHELEGVPVAAINVDTEGSDRGTADAVTRAYLKQGARFPLFIDHGLELYERWGVIAVPSMALVNGDGRVMAVLDGYPPGERSAFLQRAVAAAEQTGACYSSTAAPSGDRRAN